ncbi:MAG TPA: VCBS repeat-containing protein [Candidatus Limnocylindria bacterium]|jgi:hypothetical protein|nr:VCBS repeat-containing protein [Candidatus Limnocylindria bacterium]
MPRNVRIASIGTALLLAACGSESPSPSPSASSAQSAAPSAPAPTPDLSAYEGLWADATAETIGTTAEYTNRVELGDINGDGLPDILFANGGDYDGPSPDGPVASRVFINRGPGQPFIETPQVMAGITGYTRVIKVRDLNNDGYNDILLGNTWQTQSQLLLNNGEGYTNATAQLPQVNLNVGDLDVGDVDADGDLDLVLVDWAAGSPFESGGGPVHLWLNDGAAQFTEATAAQMPTTLIGFSWDLELVDVDNDWDLDLAVSAKVSDTSYLFENDGAGSFTDVTGDALPHFANNYEFEPMDLNGDGYLDLVTINDGDNVTGNGGQEHVFANNGDGTFSDMTESWWPDAANPSEDDNAEIFLDVDSDGDADFLLFSLTGVDRLLVNDGTGRLSLVTTAIDAAASRGSLGLAVADLDGDGRLDIVESQGEVVGSFDERVYLATEAMAPDTAAPHIWTDLATDASGTVTVHARVTDGLSPYVAGHPATVWLTWDGGDDAAGVLSWYGEYLFRITADVPAGATGLAICAADQSGNEACTEAN